MNAGDGRHAHPTQALLDMFTLWEKFDGKLQGLKIAIVGDLLHSRVVRSNLIGMTKMGMDITVCAPTTLTPVEMEKVYPGVKVEHDVFKAVKDADAIMGLRMQLERQTSGLFPSLEEYTMYYGITKEVTDLAKKDVIIMHPGPMNRGVEIASDVADSPNSVIELQVTNGVAIRMALLYLMLGGKSE